MEYARTLRDTRHGDRNYLLPAGTLVQITPATNLPGPGRYWAKPVHHGDWQNSFLENYAIHGNGVLLDIYDQDLEALPFPSIEGSYLAVVHGYVMMQKVPEGPVRIEIRGDLAYFFKPRGQKVLVVHRATSVTYGQDRLGDGNRIAYAGPADEATRLVLAAVQPRFAVGDRFISSSYAHTVTEVDNETKHYRTLLDGMKEHYGEKHRGSRISFGEFHQRVDKDPNFTQVEKELATA